MLENNDIDRLFKDELTQTRRFDKNAEQWAVVYSRLKKGSRGKIFWLLSLILLTVVVSLYFNKDIQFTTDSSAISSNEQSSEKPLIESPPILIDNDETIGTSVSPIEEKQASSSIKEQGDFKNKPNTKITSPIAKSTSAISPLQNHESITSSSNQITSTKSSSTYNSTSKEAPSKHLLLTEHFISDSYDNNIPKNEIEINKNSNGVDKQATYSNDAKVKTHSFADIFTIPYIESLKPKHLEFKSVFDPLIPYPIEPLKNNRSSFSIHSGLFLESINKDSLIDKRNLGWSLGLSMRISKMSVKLGYKNYNIERDITSDLNAYNISDSANVYGYEWPDSANLDYGNHYLDLALGYQLFSIGRLDWGVSTGIQVRKISNGKIKFTYGGVYVPLVTETILENQSFQLSSLRFGSNIHLALFNSIGLSLEYNLAIPFEIESIKWPRQHQFELGIMYNLF